MLRSHSQPSSLCPSCGYFTDRVASLTYDPALPREGDFTICDGCGQINCFTATLGQVPASRSALAELCRFEPALYAILREAQARIVSDPRSAQSTSGA